MRRPPAFRGRSEPSPTPRRIKHENNLTWRTKSEILNAHRGGLCHQFFLQRNRRSVFAGTALYFPQLLSFLFALIVAQTHGPKRLPRSLVRAASFRKAARRIALRLPRSLHRGPLLPLAAIHSALRRISGRMLSLQQTMLQIMLYQALQLLLKRRWSALPASLLFLLRWKRAASPNSVPNIFSCR